MVKVELDVLGGKTNLWLLSKARTVKTKKQVDTMEVKHTVDCIHH